MNLGEGIILGKLPPELMKTYNLKFSSRPDGRCSLIYTPSSPSQSCQTSTEVETGAIGEKTAGKQTKVLRSGNSRKSCMSWKTVRQVRERLAAMELWYSRENVLFITGTLPTVSRRGFRVMAENVGYAMDRINRFLNKRFDNKKMSRVNVWEYQNRGALHFHMVLGLESVASENLRCLRYRLARLWYSVLNDLGDKYSVKMTRGSHGKDRNFSDLMAIDDGEHFLNLQVVKKSVVAYLSTYLADNEKGKKSKKKQKLRKKFFPVSTWAQWNRTATRIRDKYVKEVKLGSCENINIVAIESAFKSVQKKLKILDGTECKYPKNPFVGGFYFLTDPSDIDCIHANIEVIKEEMQWLFDDRIEYELWLKKNRIKTGGYMQNDDSGWAMNLEQQLLLREAELVRRIEKRKSAIQMGEEMAFLGVFMLELFWEMEERLRQFPVEIIEQLEIDYE